MEEEGEEREEVRGIGGRGRGRKFRVFSPLVFGTGVRKEKYKLIRTCSLNSMFECRHILNYRYLHVYQPI